MRNYSGQVNVLALASLVALLAACSDDGGPGAGGSSSDSGNDSSGPESATITQGMSSTSASTSAGTASSTTDPGTGSSEDTAGFISPDSGGESGPMLPGPNGAECASNDECESEFCYQIPMLGGLCSECLMDADCKAGTCAVDFTAMYAMCTDGALGNMCDSDEGCMGDLVCTQLIDTMGLFNANYCSECGPTAPCEGEQICSPTYDASGISGHFSCAEPGSAPNNAGCPIEDGMGQGEVCDSGHCGVADVFMGFVQLGVCGECSVDGDCVDGGTCTPAGSGMAGLMGAVCE
ncbi:MAG: hypothetical protein IAG13_38010 [Deltaproteobacteria bacterium]|nr:hypothetical protein [Nannocystaceae bacterium]